MQVVVVIDAFRAFTTAAYVLDQNPAEYYLTTTSSTVSRIASQLAKSLLIGKPDKGETLQYHIPNSPTRVLSQDIANTNVLHRTNAGALGILKAAKADLILAASFVNADATVAYLKKLDKPVIHLVPMGHEGVTPSLEDNLCEQYISSLLEGKKISLSPYLHQLREGPGQYFFKEDQWQYPKEDFERCLETGKFNFAIQAILKNDYALLRKV